MKIILFIFIGLTLTLAPNYRADAQGLSRSSPQQSTSNKSSLKVRSSQQAAQMVKSRFGGKVLKVNSKKVNGRNGYKVKLLKKNGHVISVLVDAHSGRITGG